MPGSFGAPNSSSTTSRMSSIDIGLSTSPAGPKAEAARPKTVSTFRRFIKVPMSKPSPWSTTSSSGRGSRRPS